MEWVGRFHYLHALDINRCILLIIEGEISSSGRWRRYLVVLSTNRLVIRPNWLALTAEIIGLLPKGVELRIVN